MSQLLRIYLKFNSKTRSCPYLKGGMRDFFCGIPQYLWILKSGIFFPEYFLRNSAPDKFLIKFEKICGIPQFLNMKTYGSFILLHLNELEKIKTYNAFKKLIFIFILIDKSQSNIYLLVLKIKY